MSGNTISVNRAPVLTLWAAVVAERLGFDWDEALTLGRAVAGLNAQSKGRRLGIFKPSEEEPKETRRNKKAPEKFLVELCGRSVTAIRTPRGVRALAKDKPTEPGSVARYLETKFGDRLPEVRIAMKSLAGAFEKGQLIEGAFPLYEAFRPQIPAGTRGWGAEGELDLKRIRSLIPKNGRFSDASQEHTGLHVTTKRR
jgi:hypothetical protein